MKVNRNERMEQIMETVLIYIWFFATMFAVMWGMEKIGEYRGKSEKLKEETNWNRIELARLESEFEWEEKQKKMPREITACFLVKHGETVHLEGWFSDQVLEWTASDPPVWKEWVDFFTKINIGGE